MVRMPRCRGNWLTAPLASCYILVFHDDLEMLLEKNAVIHRVFLPVIFQEVHGICSPFTCHLLTCHRWCWFQPWVAVVHRCKLWFSSEKYFNIVGEVLLRYRPGLVIEAIEWCSKGLDQQKKYKILLTTMYPPKINMSPEKGQFQKEDSLQTIHLSGHFLLVFRGKTYSEYCGGSKLGPLNNLLTYLHISRWSHDLGKTCQRVIFANFISLE